MSQLELVSCRLAIQICIGHFPDGRERHRTFSLKDVKPDATDAALMRVVRAIEPLLAYPITKVRLVTTRKRVLFDVESGIGMDLIENRKKDAVLEAVPQTRGGTPDMPEMLDTPERETNHRIAAAQTENISAKPAEPIKIAAGERLYFKTSPAVFRRPYQKYQKNRKYRQRIKKTLTGSGEI
jgi:hypothetical protein